MAPASQPKPKRKSREDYIAELEARIKELETTAAAEQAGRVALEGVLGEQLDRLAKDVAEIKRRLP